MSRWTSNFESHAFRVSWSRTVEAMAQISVDDPSVASSLDEVARFRKVVAYLEHAIGGIDPELLPLGFWDFVRDQLNACADQLSAFNSAKNISNLQQANNHLDNLLAQVRPHMLAKGRLGPALQSAAKVYSDALTEAGSRLADRANTDVLAISGDRERAAKLVVEMQETIDRIKEEHDGLLVDSSNGEAVITVMNRHVEEIGAFHRRLTSGSAENPSIKEEIAAAREVAKSGSEAIAQLRAGAGSIITGLTTFDAKIFGTINEDGKRTGGLKDELDSRLTTLGEVEEQQKRRYATLGDKIESLLPGATSAGLASAYKQMRDSFATPIRNANLLFYASIASLVVLSLMLNVEKIGLWSIEFVHITDWSAVGRALANKLPFYAPLVWLAYYASKRRSEFQRLEQEYAHKEALAKSYDSYRQQVFDLGGATDPLMRELLVRAVDAIAFNASISLDGKHGDKIPLQEAIEKAAGTVVKELAKAKTPSL